MQQGSSAPSAKKQRQGKLLSRIHSEEGVVLRAILKIPFEVIIISIVNKCRVLPVLVELPSHAMINSSTGTR